MMVIDNDNNTMDCLEVCRQLSGDSNSNNDAIKKHLVSCVPCAAYATQQIQLTDSLQQVVNVTVPEGLASRILLQQSINEKKQIKSRRSRQYTIAASVLLSIGIFSSLLLFNTPKSLEQIVLHHILAEQQHLLDDNNVALVKLNTLLLDFNLRLNSSLGKINYAGSCTIGNSKGVHIVVQTDTGPVTILLMPNEVLKHRQLVNAAEFAGAVVPINNGSFAIVGGKQESLSNLEQRFKYGLSII